MFLYEKKKKRTRFEGATHPRSWHGPEEEMRQPCPYILPLFPLFPPTPSKHITPNPNLISGDKLAWEGVCARGNKLDSSIGPPVSGRVGGVAGRHDDAPCLTPFPRGWGRLNYRNQDQPSALEMRNYPCLDVAVIRHIVVHGMCSAREGRLQKRLTPFPPVKGQTYGLACPSSGLGWKDGG